MKRRLLHVQVILSLILTLGSMYSWVHANDPSDMAGAVPFATSDQGQIMAEPRSTITVTTFADELSENSLCSLREAIMAANTDDPIMGCPTGSGIDTIVLASGTYTLSIPGAAENSNATGDLDITASVTIKGVSSSETIINGADLDRVFDVFSKANGRFESLKITNGTAPCVATNGEHGGGIRATGSLTLNDVVVRDNHAGNGTSEFGDGGHGGGIYCSGILDITASTIQANYAGNGANISSSLGTAGDGGKGGGIMATGPATIRDSSILFNYAGNAGNGILGQQSYSGNAGHGGGIMTSNEVEISHTEIRGNHAGNIGTGPGGGAGDAGGIYNTGTLTLLTSSIADNWPGAGKINMLAGRGGGLLNYLGATTNIIMSSIDGNHGATAGVNSNGAGIFNVGTLWIVNSTIGGNVGAYSGGGIFNAGTATINSSTIAWNESQLGGGIFNTTSYIATVSNTLVAWNTGWQGGYDCEGTVTSGGYNLIRRFSTYCSIIGDLTGVMTGTSYNPLTSTYDFHGGLTKNYILLAGSPMINAGNPAPVGSGGYSCPVVDQRGVSRPQASICDIGSTETTAQFTVTKNVDVVFTYPGQLITYSITVTNIGGEAGTGITVSDDLPAALVFEGPVSLSVAHPEATVIQVAKDLPQIVTGLSLAAGESVVVNLPVRTALDYPVNQVVRNTASAKSAIQQTEGSGYKDIRTGYRLLLPMVVR